MDIKELTKTDEDSIEYTAKFLRGDCREVLKDLPNNSVDLVLTDPPYAISNGAIVTNTFSGYTSDKGDWDVYVDPKDWVPDCCRVLNPGGIFISFGVFGSLIDIWDELKIAKMNFQSHPVWEKSNPAPSLQRRMLTHANELLLIFSKGKPWYFDYEASKTYNSGKQLKNVFKFSTARKQAGVTRKPVKLISMLIDIFSPVGGMVVDPFVGSGTTVTEALKLNRNGIGFEKFQEQWDFLEKLTSDDI